MSFIMRRIMGDNIRSARTKTQNIETRLKVIACDA